MATVELFLRSKTDPGQAPAPTGAQSSATIELQVPAGRTVPCGWVRVRARGLSGVDSAVLVPGGDDGPCWVSAVPLRIDGDRIDAVALLPEVVASLTLTLTCSPGATGYFFPSLSMTPLSKARATLQGLAPLLRQPRALRRVVRGIGAAVGQAGRPALRPALREALLQRDLVDYPAWVARHDTLTAGDRAAIERHIASWPRQPSIGVVLAATPDDSEPALAATRASIAAQCYGAREVVTDATQSSADYLYFAEPGDVLSPLALYLLVHATLAAPPPTWVYGDHDTLRANGQRESPVFKPAWNPMWLQACDYIGDACLYETRAYLRLGPVADRYQARRRLGAEDVPVHVPFVTLHRPTPHRPTLHRPPHAAPAVVRPAPPLPQPAPLVTIIIPTRDHEPLLRRCIESLFARTQYSSFEVLVVDNGSREPAALRYLTALGAREGVRVLRDERPFNFGALNNGAVRHARGAVLALLNNDVEIQSPDWLGELVRHAMQPGTGAVGCKLLYPHGRIQHAGVVLGIGGTAGHVHKHLRGDAPGYLGRAQCTQNISAVTAACLVVQRARYLEVGGFDEENLPVAFSDVDFCLRLLEAGYRNVYSPYAVLLHHESPSRGEDDTREKHARALAEAAYLQRRWGARLAADPAFSPNLALCAEATLLASPPRTDRPWRAATPPRPQRARR